MDDKKLFLFAKRILNSRSVDKASCSLQQLRDLLENQGADKKQLDLLDQMLLSVPEMQDVARKDKIDKESIQIAVRRAQERKRQEMLARQYGRC